MKVFVDGPKFSGKSTLLEHLRSMHPGATCIKLRCFFERGQPLGPTSDYYVPRKEVHKTLAALASFLAAVPAADDVLLCRSHIFDWVQQNTYRSDSVPFRRYSQIEEVMGLTGFVGAILVPSSEILLSRREHAVGQDVPIPIPVLLRHREMYMQAASLTHLPIVLATDSPFDCDSLAGKLRELAERP